MFELFLKVEFSLFLIFLGWFSFGCIVLTPFAGILNNINKYDCCYNRKTETAKEAVLWPYMLFKIYKYKKDDNGSNNKRKR